MDAASPEPPATLPEASSTPGHLAESDFLCDGCGKLLYQPAILNCGHVVCQPTCLPGINCPCPECSSPILRRPEVCKQLAQLLESAFPEASAKREQEVAEHLVRLQDSEPPAEPMSLGADNAKDLPPDDETLPAPPPIELPEGIPLNGPAATIMSWLQGRDYAHFGIGCDSCGMFPIVGRRYRCKQCPESIGFDLCGTCHDRGVGRVLGRFNQKHVPEHEMEEVAPRMTSLHLLQAANPELSFEQLMTLVQLARSRDDDEEDAGGDENGGSEPGVAGNGEGDIAEAGTGDQGTDSAHAPIDVGGAVPEHTSSVVDHENMRTMALGSEGLEGSTLEDAAQGDAQEAGEMGGSEGSEEVEGAVMPLRRGPRPAPDPSAQWPSPSAPGFASDGGRDA